MYRQLAPGKVLVDYGPVSMVIEAGGSGGPMTAAALKGAETAVRQLEALSGVLDRARVLARDALTDGADPAVLNRMIEVTRATGEPDITPMAAVAGAFAEQALEGAAGEGATRIIVNNGGDIAIRLGKGESIRVGIVTDLASGKVTHFIDLKGEYGLGGIATSGFGGRSFTKGIASAVVVLAGTAAQADACATMVANAVYAGHPGIKLRKAEELDPLTDIRGQVVVEKVGRLDGPTVRKAIASGQERFFRYREKGLLFGAVIAVRDQVWMFPGGIAKEL
ncbi:MAG: UPF0280 family protein [Bacillota bacterium]